MKAIYIYACTYKCRTSMFGYCIRNINNNVCHYIKLRIGMKVQVIIYKTESKARYEISVYRYMYKHVYYQNKLEFCFIRL